jgi:amino acid transporter
MDRPAATVAGITPAPAARLEPDAIGVAQDTIIGMATTGPTVSVGLTLAALAATAAYAGGLILILTAIPMLIIANAYRRLNLWNANAGASFEWVGRAINPYLGFLTGWLMVTGTLIGTLSPVIVLGPSVLAVFGASSNSTWPNVGIATAVAVIMLVIAAMGIRLTARTQVAIAAVEYTILIGFSVAGLVWVLSHHAGSYPITSGWFSLHGIGGKGSLAAGFLLAVFIFTGWDGTIYVNEEVVHRRKNPGRAAMFAVIIVTIFFVLAQVGLQGVVSSGKLQSNSSSALVYVSGVMGGGGWAKVMALALALSVVAATGTGIVLGARILYGMASHRVLPEFLGNVSPRFATPIAASIVSGLFILVVTWIYLLATSVQNAFTNVINVTGVIYASFYVLTALAAIVYYRRRVIRSAWDAITLGVLPLAAIAFLVWVVVRQLQNSPAAQRWSLIGVVGVGIVLMLVARFVLRSSFFQIPRESDSPGAHRGGTRAA